MTLNIELIHCSNLFVLLSIGLAHYDKIIPSILVGEGIKQGRMDTHLCHYVCAIVLLWYVSRFGTTLKSRRIGWPTMQALGRVSSKSYDSEWSK